MPVILLKAAVGDYKQDLPPGAIPHCSYIKGLLEAAPDGDAEIITEHSDEILIKWICAFLDRHKDDEPVLEGWEKSKPRELTQADKDSLLPIVGIALVNLLKACNFLGSQIALNAVATYVGQVLVTKNEKEVQEYFGVFREFTPAEEQQVREKYPVPFY